MVVHPAVIGLARQWGIGDQGEWNRHARGHRVGGQQRRAQRRLPGQPSTLVEAQQRLRAAVDARHLVDVGKVRGAGVAGGGVVGGDSVDFDTGIPRT